MSEENPQPAAEPATQPITHDGTPVVAAKPVATISPVAVLSLVAIALLAVLIVMQISKKSNGVVSMDDPALATLRADLETRRIELNRQRLALGKAPLQGGSEPLEEIASRLQKDSGTLVALSTKFQDLLADKDNELYARNADFIRSEQTRDGLVNENARLQSELQRLKASGSDVDALRRELGLAKSQRDALAAELDAAREKLSAQGDTKTAAEYEDLSRRYEEARSARIFFENRVKELEAPAGSPPAGQ